MKNLLIALLMCIVGAALAQEDTQKPDKMTLPYASIPDAPEKYTAGTVAARMADGLGFRYYWATEGLTAKDLEFKPNEEARTTAETIHHILQLTTILRNAVEEKPNDGGGDLEGMTFDQKRTATLDNIKKASEILRVSSDKDLERYKIIFSRPDGKDTIYPFWNMLNGPLADAIWHVGQVVSFRRSSGNPFNSKVSVLNGKLRD